MPSTLTTTLALHALCVLYLAVFAEASLSKILARETPAWFQDQFRETWLGKTLPMPMMWWGIAVAELAVAGLFAAAVLTGGAVAGGDTLLLEFGLIGAALVFAGLCFGLRVAIDFAGAASAFFYGALSLTLWFLLRLALVV